MCVQVLTQKVMGDSNYLVNPCVIVCPFAGPKCQHGHFRMNGNCKPSQLCTPSLRPHLRGPHLTHDLTSRAASPQHASHAHTIQARACPAARPRVDSHWQTVHKSNPAAKQLEARWRKAIKNKMLTLAQLDACAPCQMTGDADGYEPLREASVTTCHFPHSFALGSSEYYAWLQATDEL